MAGASSERAPIWLRLVRLEKQVIAYKSTDGKTWSRIGDAMIDLGADLLAGVAVASRDPASTTIAAFDKLRVAPEEPGRQYGYATQ